VRRAGPNVLRLISIGLLLAALALVILELIAYSRARARLPEALTVAGVDVSGLDQGQAIERLLQVYSTPIQLIYRDQVIQMAPASAGFRLDTEALMGAAELERTGKDFWSGFWDFLWNRPSAPVAVPVKSEYSRAQLETVLRDIAARYDEPPTLAEPIPGTPNFSPGEPGIMLDIARASDLVADVMSRPEGRRVNLPVAEDVAPRPDFPTLQILLQQIVDLAGFDGLAAIYVRDLRTGEDLHMVYDHNQVTATEPDPAFTAASIIKVAIATAFYRQFDEPLDEEASRWMEEMIKLSGNDPADWLMERLSPSRGPLIVTDTMMDGLGLKSTFLAGFFHPGAPLLWQYQTPGNTRPDIQTNPDPYNQTTATEMGMLLSDLYACSRGGGSLLAAFPGQIKPEECQHILDLMAQNKIGILIEAGVPEGTRVAHKHGWTDSPLDSIGDAGIVYSPGGDYVVSLFLWNHPEMVWEPTSNLVGELSRAIYNYFNPPTR
jgi:beta-lactamase class A